METESETIPFVKKIEELEAKVKELEKKCQSQALELNEQQDEKFRSRAKSVFVGESMHIHLSHIDMP